MSRILLAVIITLAVVQATKAQDYKCVNQTAFRACSSEVKECTMEKADEVLVLTCQAAASEKDKITDQGVEDLHKLVVAH